MFFVIFFTNAQTSTSNEFFSFKKIGSYLIKNNITNQDHFGLTEKSYITIRCVPDKIIVDYIYNNKKVGNLILYPNNISDISIKSNYFNLLERKKIIEYSYDVLKMLENDGNMPDDGSVIKMSIIKK